jgi:hypothetical protein
MTYLPHLHSSHLHSSHLQDLHLPHSHFSHLHLPHLQASFVTATGAAANTLAKLLSKIEKRIVFIRLSVRLESKNRFPRKKDPGRREQGLTIRVAARAVLR